MKRPHQDLDRGVRRQAILSQRISDKERAQLNRIQGRDTGTVKKRRKKIAKRVTDFEKIRLDDRASDLPPQIQRNLQTEMDKAIKQYDQARSLSGHRPYTLEAIEEEKKRTDPLYASRRDFYANRVYGTDSEVKGGKVEIEREPDQLRPLKFLGVDMARSLVRSKVYEFLQLRLPMPRQIDVEGDEESVEEEDRLFYASKRMQHLLGRNVRVHDTVHVLEDTLDVTLFEMHLLGKKAVPEWVPYTEHASGLLALDCMIDGVGHFLLRLVYSIYEPVDGDDVGVPGCDMAEHGQVSEIITRLSRLDEIAERATLPRRFYRSLPVDLKMMIGQLPLQGLAFYYLAPTPNSDAPLNEAWARSFID